MAVGEKPAAIRVDVLGPLRLLVDGVEVAVRGPKRRAMLALLVLAEGRVVAVDSLVDALWPSELPESGRQALHTHVSRLRTQLGSAAARLETRPDGYRLRLEAGELDLFQARAALATARRLARADPAGALAVLREARALWQGPVLADLTDTEQIAASVQAAAQLHRDVTDGLLHSAIGTGQADGVLGIAAASLAADPLREPAVLLHMRALAASGRAPEAMRAGREYRRRLADETGLDPSPALDELERDIADGTVAATSPRPEAPAAPSAAAAAAGSPPARPPAGPTTRLIGREPHVAALHRLLATERLVTLVGPGGVGKTRVALEVARGTAAATVVLLAPVPDPAALPHALAAALNLAVVQGDVLAACIAVLGERPGLLVVDNCEHLLDAVRDAVGAVLAGCPGLVVLATSREPLGLAAEYAFRLPPLPLPRPDREGPSPEASVGSLQEVPSVAVFLDRAARVRPGPLSEPADLQLVADIVRRLDGMPLAIELAAGRLSTFSLVDLHERLDRSLDLLGSGRPSNEARHRTLRATIAWSYDLLTADEQRMFRHLSIFVDGVELPTAERLGVELGLGTDPGSVLARLVDASMVDAVFEGGTRYRMLETVRAFGSDQLAVTGEEEAAAAALLAWAVELTADFAEAVSSEHEPAADARLRRELANLRAAWRQTRSRGALDAAAAMVPALLDAVTYRDLVEIRGWAGELAGDPALLRHPRAAAVLGTAAEAAYQQGNYPRAEQLARAGLELATDAVGKRHCLLPLSVAALARGSYAEVVDYALASAALPGWSRESFGIAALATAYAGDLDRARTLNDRGLAVATSPSMRSWAEYVAAEVESAAGRSERAEEHYVRAVELARSSGATFLVGVAMVGLLTVRAAAGRTQDALRGYREVVDYFARTGNWTHLWVTLRNLADLLRRLGEDEPACLLDCAADRAPDAPVDDRSRVVGSASAAARAPVLPRAAVLDVAREAIERALAAEPDQAGRGVASTNDSSPTQAV